MSIIYRSKNQYLESLPFRMSASTAELGGIISKFTADYKKATPLKLKLIDAYLTYCFFTGVIQVNIYTTIYMLRLQS